VLFPRGLLSGVSLAPVALLPADDMRLGAEEEAGYFRLAQFGALHSLSTRVNEIWLGVRHGLEEDDGEEKVERTDLDGAIVAG
jgi:hypothetical protein